jgi:hypothetical protein
MKSLFSALDVHPWLFLATPLWSRLSDRKALGGSIMNVSRYDVAFGMLFDGLMILDDDVIDLFFNPPHRFVDFDHHLIQLTAFVGFI